MPRSSCFPCRWIPGRRSSSCITPAPAPCWSGSWSQPITAQYLVRSNQGESSTYSTWLPVCSSLTPTSHPLFVTAAPWAGRHSGLPENISFKIHENISSRSHLGWVKIEVTDSALYFLDDRLGISAWATVLGWKLRLFSWEGWVAWSTRKRTS